MSTDDTRCIGIDLDNTIVAYDALFHRLACERTSIPAHLPETKLAVRTHLREVGAEDVWTELQAEAYGPRMSEAQPFPHALGFIHAARTARIRLAIISHRTRTPYRGVAHDLHAAARAWLTAHGLAGTETFLETSQEAKCARIADRRCVHFIDDLPEFLGHPSFPTGVERILFDPDDHHPEARVDVRAHSWAELARYFRLDLGERR